MQKVATAIIFFCMLTCVFACSEFDTETHKCTRQTYECACEPREPCKKNQLLICGRSDPVLINTNSMFWQNIECNCRTPCDDSKKKSDFCGDSVCNSNGEWEYHLNNYETFTKTSGAKEVCDPIRKIVWFYSIYMVSQFSNCVNDDAQCISDYCANDGKGCRIGMQGRN